MRVGGLILIAGVLIIGIFAAPLVYFMYYLVAHEYQAITVNVSSTPGSPCSATRYSMTLYYQDPIPISEVSFKVAFEMGNGSTYVTEASTGLLTAGHSLFVCVPGDVLVKASAVAINVTGYVAGLYLLSVSTQQSLG
ncbi:MAG: hypothetical protein ACP5HK_04265 [Acidilobus sp.]